MDMKNKEIQYSKAYIIEKQNICNRPMTDDEMDLWTLLCEGVKEQKEKWQRGKSKYFVEDNIDFA